MLLKARGARDVPRSKAGSLARREAACCTSGAQVSADHALCIFSAGQIRNTKKIL